MAKLFKRLICTCLAAFMLLPSYTLANDSDSLTDLGDELLYGLEIIDRDESPEGTVTRGQFADIFTKSNMLYSEDFVPSNPFSDTRESDYFTSIEILHNLGIVTGMSDNKFLPDEFMKTEDMLRLFINALGLEEYYRISGATVLSAASELGLLKNVPYSDTLTIKNLMKVTYNFLTAPIGKYSLSDGKKLSIDNNDNVLHAKFKIEKITATVVENELSGIWAKSNLGKGCVKLKSDAGMIMRAPRREPASQPSLRPRARREPDRSALPWRGCCRCQGTRSWRAPAPPRRHRPGRDRAVRGPSQWRRPHSCR